MSVAPHMTSLTIAPADLPLALRQGNIPHDAKLVKKDPLPLPESAGVDTAPGACCDHPIKRAYAPFGSSQRHETDGQEPLRRRRERWDAVLSGEQLQGIRRRKWGILVRNETDAPSPPGTVHGLHGVKLRPFLESRKKEVTDIMTTLFSDMGGRTSQPRGGKAPGGHHPNDLRWTRLEPYDPDRGHATLRRKRG